jgi:LmbE family N-acetylglucosaminyl deacetylase
MQVYSKSLGLNPNFWIPLSIFVAAASGAQDAAPDPACRIPQPVIVAAPAEPACANEELTAFDALLVLAPHPDDETLGFAGLIAAYRAQGKPVEVVVATDGDAYCEACRFWKTGSVRGPTCGAADLSNFATTAVDSFAEVRRGESAAAAAVLGREPPAFLGYPDTGLAAAWRGREQGTPETRLRRSDFSACGDCETCPGGYGEGPETELSAATLTAALAGRLAATTPRTLVATTHWLDGHGDHAALGSFVKTLNGELARPRAVVYTVIHAHTPKATPHPDCWYPGPQAVLCPCALESCADADPEWISTLREHRLRPSWPGGLPDDADYGIARHLCLPEAMYEGGGKKLAAIRAYASQLGFLAREGELPERRAGIMDCNGYLIAFARRTEAFVLAVPEPEAGP